MEKNDDSPNSGERLDRKTLERINRLTIQQIEELEAKYMDVLTHEFDERYMRRIMAKGKSVADQRKLLDAMTVCFYKIYWAADGFTILSMPSCFDELDSALAFGELIQDAPTTQQPTQHAASMQGLSATLEDVERQPTILLESVENLEKHLSESQEEYNRVKHWYDDWQRLRDVAILALYDPHDIAEAGSIDDSSVMEDMIEAIMTSRDLKKENEELRMEQEARLKSVKTEDDFVKRLVKETKKLYKHERKKAEVVRQILYKLGRSDAEEELDAWIEGRANKTTVNVNGDLVMNKHVENEVDNVEGGATGISVNKEKEQAK